MKTFQNFNISIKNKERIVDLTKAISGMEGKRLQSIAFKIYNARVKIQSVVRHIQSELSQLYKRKEVWERVRSKKSESSKKPIHDELQKHLEDFLDKKKEEKKIDVEQIQKFRNTEQYTKQTPTVDLYKIISQYEKKIKIQIQDQQIQIQRGLPQEMDKLKKLFEVQESDSD